MSPTWERNQLPVCRHGGKLADGVLLLGGAEAGKRRDTDTLIYIPCGDLICTGLSDDKVSTAELSGQG